MRYETLSQTKSAYQAAIPSKAMEVLREHFGVRHECFASPLNRYFDSFCSLFQDTDQFFGSVGSFYDFRPDMGSFQCNPPFDQQSLVSAFAHVYDLLSTADGPLSFFVCVPKIDVNRSFLNFDPDVLKMLDGTSKFLKHRTILAPHTHGYLMGLQHRKSGDSTHWISTKPSMLSWFQNEAGSHVWPAQSHTVELVVSAFQEVVAGAQTVSQNRSRR